MGPTSEYFDMMGSPEPMRSHPGYLEMEVQMTVMSTRG